MPFQDKELERLSRVIMGRAVGKISSVPLYGKGKSPNLVGKFLEIARRNKPK